HSELLDPERLRLGGARVTSRTTARFRRAYAELPERVRLQAREAYRKFVRDPQHASIRVGLSTRSYRQRSARRDWLPSGRMGAHSNVRRQATTGSSARRVTPIP